MALRLYKPNATESDMISPILHENHRTPSMPDRARRRIILRIYTRERRFSPESPERTSAVKPSASEALDMAADEMPLNRL